MGEQKTAGKCPVMHGTSPARGNRDWWPNQLDLHVLHQHSDLSDPMGESFDYAKEFESLDLDALVRDLHALMTDSQDWWPADFGHYGPFFIRMAWHSAGTYRVGDGRGGGGRGTAALRAAQQLAGQREPRQGAAPAVADQAEVRPQDLLGRPDDPRRATSRSSRWASRPSASAAAARTPGSRTRTSTGAARASGSPTSATRASANSRIPLGAVQMGLIYVNPEGPNGNPDPLAAARDIRDTFARMAMNDEETVALIAGGHTFGKTHGAGDAALVGVEPEGELARGAGPRLGEHVRRGQGRRRDHQRPRGHLDHDAHEVEQQLLPEPVRLRLGADQEPCRRAPVDAESRHGRRHRAARARQVEARHAGDADDRPRAALRSRLREDLAPLPREPGPVRRRFRARLVQAHAPRHGAASRATSARSCRRSGCSGRIRSPRSTIRWSATPTSRR